MIEIHCVNLTKKKLAAMPVAERTLLLLLGHANNEINVLSKLILMVRKDEPPIKIVDHVEAGQIFILMRVLIGKLHEAWELFKKRVQADQQLAAKYLPRLTQEAAAALGELNKHFGQKSPLTEIRNKISFHYKDDDGLIEANFQRLPETEPWEFYLSRTVGNSFYFASELVVAGGVISLIEPRPNGLAASDLSNDARAFGKLCAKVISVSRQITELFGDLTALIVQESVDGVELTTVELPDGPKLSAFVLPFFTDEHDSLPQRQRSTP